MGVARDRKWIVVIHAAECVLRARSADRRAQCAGHGIHAPPLDITGQRVEIHHRIEQFRVWREWSSRWRDHLMHLRGCQCELQGGLSDQAGRAGQQKTTHVRLPLRQWRHHASPARVPDRIG
ncbi:hypothetical protein D9M69_623660 [compost metagenome]